jgi:hypothetical protein
MLPNNNMLQKYCRQAVDCPKKEPRAVHAVGVLQVVASACRLLSSGRRGRGMGGRPDWPINSILKPPVCCWIQNECQPLRIHSGRAKRYCHEPSDEIMSGIGRFNTFACPNCNALYQVVKVEAGPETADREITCLACGSPLTWREGKFALKYFLLREAVRRRRQGRAKAV